MAKVRAHISQKSDQFLPSLQLSSVNSQTLPTISQARKNKVIMSVEILMILTNTESGFFRAIMLPIVSKTKDPEFTQIHTISHSLFNSYLIGLSQSVLSLDRITAIATIYLGFTNAVNTQSPQIPWEATFLGVCCKFNFSIYN